MRLDGAITRDEVGPGPCSGCCHLSTLSMLILQQRIGYCKCLMSNVFVLDQLSNDVGCAERFMEIMSLEAQESARVKASASLSRITIIVLRCTPASHPRGYPSIMWSARSRWRCCVSSQITIVWWLDKSRSYVEIAGMLGGSG